MALTLMLAATTVGVTSASADSTTPPTIDGCVHNMTGALRVVGSPSQCKPEEH